MATNASDAPLGDLAFDSDGCKWHRSIMTVLDGIPTLSESPMHVFLASSQDFRTGQAVSRAPTSRTNPMSWWSTFPARRQFVNLSSVDSFEDHSVTDCAGHEPFWQDQSKRQAWDLSCWALATAGRSRRSCEVP